MKEKKRKQDSETTSKREDSQKAAPLEKGLPEASRPRQIKQRAPKA